MVTAVAIAAFVVLVINTLISPETLTQSEELDDPTNPFDLLFLLGSIAVILPAVILGSRWGGGMRGLIHSIAGHVRWKMLWQAALVILPIYAAVHGVTFIISPPADFAWPAAGARTALVFALILVLTPLQSAAEEYLFRGLPLQLLGTWFRSPLWGIVPPVPLFMIGHGYNWVGQIDLAAFALCMGFLVWKSGGLELAIVVHAANNLVLFLLAPFSVSSLHQGAVPLQALLLSVPLMLGITAGLTLWVSRTKHLSVLEPLRKSTPSYSIDLAARARSPHPEIAVSTLER